MKNIFITRLLKFVTQITFSIIYVLITASFSFLVANFLKGKNVSDVGVRMYENADLALAVGLLVYLLLSWLLLGVGGKILSKNPLKFSVRIGLFLVGLVIDLPLLLFAIYF